MRCADPIGAFTERGSYVIRTPSTPTRWENTLFNDRYVLRLTPRMTGTSFRVQDSVQHPVLEDRGFYLRAGGAAARLFSGQGSDFLAEFDLPSSRAEETVGAVRAEALAFVPAEGLREFWQLTLTNTGAEDAEADLFCLFPFYAQDTMGGHARLGGDGKSIVKYAFPFHVRYGDMEKASRNMAFSYAVCDRAPDSWAGSRYHFLGHDDPLALPKCVADGVLPSVPGEGFDLAAGFHFRVRLAPGASERIRFTAGCARERAEVEALQAEFPDFDAEYGRVCRLWEERCAAFTVRTEDPVLDHLMNRWFKKQAVYLSRTNRCDPYQSVRSQMQDGMAYALIEPEEVLKLALDVLKNQREDGYIKEWTMADGSPDRNLCLLDHSDAPVWLILCVTEIINATGDARNFERKVPLADTGREADVLEHLKAAADYMLKETGSHGLCLLKDGDWTDPINGAGRFGRGESVWNSMALVYAIRELTAVCPDERLSRAADGMAEKIERFAWDGAWYVAGFDDEGKPFGSRSDPEPRIFLITQAWAFIAGIVPEERKAALADRIEGLRTPFGYLLLSPAFPGWDPVWGRISIKQAGTAENGSAYNHATLFKALGDCLRGDRAAAWRTILSILPTNPENPAARMQLPLYVPNYYFSLPGPNYGASSCNSATCSNAWILWVTLQFALGARCTVNGPAFAEDRAEGIGPYTVTRRFAGKTLTLEQR